MDIEKYRKDYLSELRATEPRQTATPNAVANYAASDERDSATLCEMLRNLPLRPESFAATVRTLLDVLGNESIDADARLVALRQLGAAEFQPVPFAQFHAEFVELLRQLAVSDDKRIRAAALERLTLANDPEAQRLLREGLEQVRKPLVPTAKAIQLLSRDDHAGILPLMRDLAVSAKGRVREQALRALASDPRSATLFESIAADKAEKPALRQIAATNLKNTSATKFAKLARTIALDDREDDKLRAVAVSAIAHSSDVASKLSAPSFAKALDAAGLKTSSRALKSSIGRFARAVKTRSE